VCDRLLIGGSTVREDSPTLDCRFSGGSAPDVTIYSRDDYFDKSIPLFGIEGRSVEVTNRLEIFEQPAFIIAEGGEGMLRALQDRIDWMLLYQTPKLSTNDLSYNIDMNLTFLHQRKIDVDLMIWSRHSGD
jgi:diaminohydroxyphosphoribosylaminopyrimidine deaminase/5-amino-6-(5-phosphoribosylamino)uracil reductase